MAVLILGQSASAIDFGARNNIAPAFARGLEQELG
jgi:hypothetical protein